MQTPAEIEFQGMTANPKAQAAIADHVAELEQRFGRVTACRVVLKAPGGHHRTGGLYEVNIRLALPDGREVNVDRTPKADERHSDLSFAINDAFKRARRQLQDRVRELQGQVKHHEGSPWITSAGQPICAMSLGTPASPSARTKPRNSRWSAAARRARWVTT